MKGETNPKWQMVTSTSVFQQLMKVSKDIEELKSAFHQQNLIAIYKTLHFTQQDWNTYSFQVLTEYILR